ncbi:MAG: phosphonoacetaldehyde reductase, partial [Pirellulales bacterium]
CDNLAAVGEILDRLSCQSVFLVADPVAFEMSGASESLGGILASRRVTVFREFQPNPNLGELLCGIESYRACQPDIVLAVGGGTAIDLAKLTGFCAAQPADPVDLIKSPTTHAHKGPPVVAAPTTAGTGSEATHFAAVYLDGRKYSLAHPYLLPDFAIVDASLTESMPPSITAETGLDAFCQAVESIWSVHSTNESIGYAAEAIPLAWRHLEAAVRHPTRDDRVAMCRAAHLAGKAINISKTTASHAISYTITSELGVPHGRAVALTLGPMLAFVSAVVEEDCSDPRGPDHVRHVIDQVVQLLGCRTAAQTDRAIQQWIASLDCPTRLAEVGTTGDAGIEMIVSGVNVDRMANNPRRLTDRSLEALLKSIQ